MIKKKGQAPGAKRRETSRPETSNSSLSDMNSQLHRRIARYLGGVAVLFLCTVSVQAAVQLSGRLEWLHKVEMRAIENGVVEQVLVIQGQHVKKGDLLLRMDQRQAQADALSAKARVARGVIAVEDAQRELDRAQELYDRGTHRH